MLLPPPPNIVPLVNYRSIIPFDLPRCLNSSLWSVPGAAVHAEESEEGKGRAGHCSRGEHPCAGSGGPIPISSAGAVIIRAVSTAGEKNQTYFKNSCQNKSLILFFNARLDSMDIAFETIFHFIFSRCFSHDSLKLCSLSLFPANYVGENRVIAALTMRALCRKALTHVFPSLSKDFKHLLKFKPKYFLEEGTSLRTGTGFKICMSTELCLLTPCSKHSNISCLSRTKPCHAV